MRLGRCARARRGYTVAFVSSATTRALASRVGDARRRLDATFAGRYANELVELRVIDRALAVASKLFIAVLPISILSTAVVSGDSFGDELVRRFGLTDSGADAARLLFAAPTQVEASIGLLGVVILCSSVLSSRARWSVCTSTAGGCRRSRRGWGGGCCGSPASCS